MSVRSPLRKDQAFETWNPKLPEVAGPVHDWVQLLSVLGETEAQRGSRTVGQRKPPVGIQAEAAT